MNINYFRKVFLSTLGFVLSAVLLAPSIAYAQDVAALPAIDVDRVYENDDTLEFVDELTVPKLRNFTLPNGFRVVASQDSAAEVCYGELDIDEVRHFLIGVTKLDDGENVSLFSSAGQRYAITDEDLYKGVKGQSQVELIDSDEFDCANLVALLQTSPSLIAGGVSSQVAGLAALIGFGIYVFTDDTDSIGRPFVPAPTPVVPTPASPAQ